MSMSLRLSLGILLSLSLFSSAALAKRTPSGPIVCKGNQNLVIRGKIVRGRRVAVRAKGNCDLTIVNSVLIGGKMGLQVTGNATVKLKGNSIRGKRFSMVMGGNATVRDLGNNRFRGKIRRLGQNVTFTKSRSSRTRKNKKARGFLGVIGRARIAPVKGGFGYTLNQKKFSPRSFRNARAPKGLRRSKVIKCVGSQKIVLRRRFIRTSRTAIVLMGSCRLLLVDSWIYGKLYGIQVMGSGKVSILRSFVRGRKAAIQIIGSSTIVAKHSKLVGGFSRIGSGKFKNLGGNILR